MAIEFTLPDLGEGIDEADVIRIHVSDGDVIGLEDPVIDIETEKATLDVPSSVEGKVVKIHVTPGQTISPGQLLLTLEEVSVAAMAPAPAATEAESVPSRAVPPAPAASLAASVPPPAPTPVAAPTAPPAPAETAAIRVVEAAPGPGAEPEDATQRTAFAAPSVRKFAREIGVDIHKVAGSGPAGRISEEDVKRHARDAGPAQVAADPAGGPPEAPPLPDFSQFGPVDREPLTRFRRTVARNMALSWTHIPHVTLFHTADVTELESIRQRYKQRAADAGGSLSMTAILLKIVAGALHAHPRVNASLDLERGELVLKRYCHISVAVDTERGLVVPVIRDVDQKNIIQLAVELTDLARRARSAELTLEEMRGASFTVTNLGGLGTGHFTPIINYPEVAILGIGRAERAQVDFEGEFQPRLRLPLALSHDHRVIDGADGARFMSWIVDAINQPLMLALEG